LWLAIGSHVKYSPLQKLPLEQREVIKPPDRLMTWLKAEAQVFLDLGSSQA
jgi:hypothetical protein